MTSRAIRSVGGVHADGSAHTFGSDERDILPVTNRASEQLYVGAFKRHSTGQRILLLIVKVQASVTVGLSGAGVREGDQARVIGYDLGGFAAPAMRAAAGQNASLELGPFAVATLVLP